MNTESQEPELSKSDRIFLMRVRGRLSDQFNLDVENAAECMIRHGIAKILKHQNDFEKVIVSLGKYFS